MSAQELIHILPPTATHAFGDVVEARNLIIFLTSYQASSGCLCACAEISKKLLMR